MSSIIAALESRECWTNLLEQRE